MATFFTTAKAFVGQSSVINEMRSAVGSGASLEIILFGDDEGAANVCRELGIHHR